MSAEYNPDYRQRLKSKSDLKDIKGEDPPIESIEQPKTHKKPKLELDGKDNAPEMMLLTALVTATDEEEEEDKKDVVIKKEEPVSFPIRNPPYPAPRFSSKLLNQNGNSLHFPTKNIFSMPTTPPALGNELLGSSLEQQEAFKAALFQQSSQMRASRTIQPAPPSTREAAEKEEEEKATKKRKISEIDAEREKQQGPLAAGGHHPAVFPSHPPPLHHLKPNFNMGTPPPPLPHALPHYHHHQQQQQQQRPHPGLAPLGPNPNPWQQKSNSLPVPLPSSSTAMHFQQQRRHPPQQQQRSPLLSPHSLPPPSSSPPPPPPPARLNLPTFRPPPAQAQVSTENLLGKIEKVLRAAAEQGVLHRQLAIATDNLTGNLQQLRDALKGLAAGVASGLATSPRYSAQPVLQQPRQMQPMSPLGGPRSPLAGSGSGGSGGQVGLGKNNFADAQRDNAIAQVIEQALLGFLKSP
jgi:hypothetical protein